VQVDNVLCTAEIIAGTRHEGVTKTTKISPITHFFSEEICNVRFAGNLMDGNFPISNPFASGVFANFDVTIAFGCHVVTPFNSGVIGIV
jgi:hypothetical protein